MKNMTEGLAVMLVVLLSLLIIGLIVQYNMIEEKTNNIDLSKLMPAKVEKREGDVNAYLKKMENYEDVDVEVDSVKAAAKTEVNVEKAQIELKNDDIVNDIGAAVDSALDGQ